MARIVIVRLSFHVAWSAHQILTLNTFLHAIVRILEKYYAE